MSTLTKKVIGFGTATLAASAVGAFMAAAPAQAMKISGSVTIDGPASFSMDPFPMSDTIEFLDEQITSGTGSFMVGQGVEVEDLTLEFDSFNGPDSALYTYEALTPFITFNDGLTFKLDEGEATREFLGSFAGGNILLNLTTLDGKFVNASGEQVAKGLLTAQSVGDAKNFSIDLTVVEESVPEPATMLGLGVVAGSLALSRAGKKNKA